MYFYLQRLRNLHIEFEHEVPDQHAFDNFRPTKALTAAEKEEFQKITPLKKGPYLDREDWQLQANWVSFCKVMKNFHKLFTLIFLMHAFLFAATELGNR